MKSKMTAMFVAGLALVVGAFFVTPPAEALSVTTKRPATVSVSSSAHYTYILGLDSNIWFTLSSSLGGTKANTGNANNPFDISAVNFQANGFVITTGTSFCSGGFVNNAASAVGVCSQNWVKLPSAANFLDGPSASLFGPVASSTSGAVIAAASTVAALFPFLPASTHMLITLVAPGLDNNLWYTMIDGTGAAASSVSMNRQSATTGVGQLVLPSSDPFTVTGENNDTGFVQSVSGTTLVTQCGTLGSLSRTCTGIWAPYP